MANGLLCVVLGGTGFLGQRLCQGLTEAGHKVRSISRSGLPSKPGPWSSHIEWVAAAIGTEQCAQGLQGADLIFHLASATLPSTSNADMVYDLEANVVATVRVLEMAASIGVPRLVFVSSGGTVYGAAHQIPIPESHPTEPICSYGIHKLAIEKYLQLFRLQGRLDSVILRISNLYGESQDCARPQGAVAHFVNRALEGAPIEIWGDGSAVRDYIYINDAVTALLQAASYAGTERLFNVGSGQGITLNRLTELLGQRLSRTIAVEYRPPRNCDVQANVLDTSRAQRELSWAPSVPFEVGLERAVRAAEKRQTARV